MANSWIHAQASARHFGGKPEDYHPIHLWIDQFKSTLGDVRHRSFLHHSKGPFMAEEQFGPSIWVDAVDRRTGETVRKEIMVRDIAENHIVEDLGWIPSPADWADCMTCKVWMGGKKNKFIGREELLDSAVDIPNPSRKADA